jgi:ABC-type bacteriocin/lantibiotic exporter with double-glycine peptidase domain
MFERIMAVILSWICLLWLTESSAMATDHPSDAWRSPANGPLNALYCYLRAHGSACEYAELRAEYVVALGGASHTIEALSALSAAQGLPLHARSMTMGELGAHSKPVLVHMDGQSPDHGAFLLVLSMTDREVFCVNGASATVHAMAHEDFRRVWSGIALLATPCPNEHLLLGAGGCALGMVLAVVRRLAGREGVSQTS